MSEIKSRPSGPRGRGSARGGRGGPSTRGRGGRTNSGKPDTPTASSYDGEGEIGELKSRYHSQLGKVKEIYPDWTDEDIVFALQETDGDLVNTIDRIAEGTMPQWGEVKKKTRERPQSKQPKEAAATSTETATPAIRGGRGRGGAEAARGGRGRGSDRGSESGRGATRGGRGARGAPQPKLNGYASNNKTQQEVIPNDQGMGGWDTATADADSTPLDSSWENVTAEQVQPPAQEEARSATKPEAPKSWASMFAKPKPAPPAKPLKAAPSHDALDEPSIPATTSATDGVPQVAPIETVEAPLTPPTSDLLPPEPAADITPPKDDLTEDNLDKIPDVSAPHVSATAASTAASTVDQRVVSGTPLGSSQQTSERPPLGGYATSAYKATGMPGRTASYQRKILGQQEAVVMPGKHAVDKAAVQFGSMGLNGAPEDLDVDSDREDAETRAQPPQHSPVAPRASLPPAPEQMQGVPPAQPLETQQAPRQAPGLPPVSQPPGSQQPPLSSAPESQPSSQAAYNYSQYGDRFGQPPSSQPESSAPPQKPYEPFGQQLQQSQHYDPFSNAGYGGLPPEARQYLESKVTSGPTNNSSYYTSEEQRNAYQSGSYGGFGQHSQSGAESNAPQPRTNSAIGSSAPSQPSQQVTSHGRFGQGLDSQGSGHSTPYGQPPATQHHGSAPSQQHGGYGYGGYPYGGYYSSYNMGQMGNHPYGRGERQPFDDARRYEDSYLSQSPGYGYGGQAGYGGGHFGGGGTKGMYGQQHAGYGISPQTPHDQHSASPANAGAFGQQLPTSGRDSAVAGLSSYGARSGSAQPSDNIHSGNQSNPSDVFGRSASGFQGQNQGFGSGNEDPLRGYGESKVPGGPSPALGQSGGRPGSAVNPQTGLPPQDARFSAGYGAYPSHSQYGGGPGAGGHGSSAQSHQYGGYAAGGYGNSYYGGSNRGGWGATYGH